MALLHGFLIFFVVFTAEAALENTEPPPKIMKLVDIREDIPPPPPPPPPPPKPVAPQQQVVEALAETMIETEKIPEDQVVVESISQQYNPTSNLAGEAYLRMDQISKRPGFSEQDLRAIANYLREQYPPIALRSGLEGRVILELSIDARGKIRRIDILKEDPEGRGFGEVAVNAFRGVQAIPAEANGTQVGVRYRYPIRFTIR